MRRGLLVLSCPCAVSFGGVVAMRVAAGSSFLPGSGRQHDGRGAGSIVSDGCRMVAHAVALKGD
jgi:hypothetical protein